MLIVLTYARILIDTYKVSPTSIARTGITAALVERSRLNQLERVVAQNRTVIRGKFRDYLEITHTIIIIIYN